jgi:hypothetical protein
VEANLSGLANLDVSVTAWWSILVTTVPASICQGYAATLTVWGYDGATWSLFDQLTFYGATQTDSNGGPACNPVLSSSLRDEQGTPFSNLPAGTFTKFRAAVVASDCGRLLPVDVSAITFAASED